MVHSNVCKANIHAHKDFKINYVLKVNLERTNHFCLDILFIKLKHFFLKTLGIISVSLGALVC